MSFTFNASPLPSPKDYWGTTAESMIQLAQSLISDAEGFSKTLNSVAEGLIAPVVGMPSFNVPDAPSASLANEPTLMPVTWSVPTAPNPFTQTINIANILPGPFTGVAPSLNFGSPPAAFAVPVPTPPNPNLNFDFPTVTVDLPDLPNLLTLDVVPFNPLVIPTFDETVPALTLNPPKVIAFIEGAQFTSTLLTQVQNDLQHALSDGTFTGLPPDIEENIWGAAREREYRAQADALSSLNRMEELGWSFPPGVFLDEYAKIQTESNYTMAGLSRDIATKQADLILTNITNARKIAVELESKLIDYMNLIQERAFQSSKYLTEAAIQIYNGQIQVYQAQLKGYEVTAEVYDTRIKGIQAQVANTQAQLEFEKTKASINTDLVQQYTSQVNASLATVEIFKAQVQIIQTEAEVAKISVDIFAQEINAFVGQVNAYTARIEAYKAQAETQGVIENVYKTQSEVYKVQVDAAVEAANVLIEQYKGQIQAYLGTIEGFKAQVQSMVGQAQAASLFNTAQADVFRSESAALSSYNGTLTAQWTAVVNEQIQAAQVAIAAAKANGDLYVAEHGIAIEAAKVGAQVTAQLGAAALGSIHWSSTAGWTYGVSSAQSGSMSNITETITSTVESA